MRIKTKVYFTFQTIYDLAAVFLEFDNFNDVNRYF